MKPEQTNIRGAGFCPGCGWGIDIHPFDAEWVDVGRCPTEKEQQWLRDAPDLYTMLLVVRDFPPAPPTLKTDDELIERHTTTGHQS